MKEKPTELTYASDLKEIINLIIKENDLPFSKALVEMSKDGKRTDILVYDKNENIALIIEVKRPSESIFDEKVVKQAYDYSKSYKERGVKYFATHNVNLLGLWDATTGKRVDQFAITYIKELDEYFRKKDDIHKKIEAFLKFYVQLLQGTPPKPIDQGIIDVIHGMITGIVNQTNFVTNLINCYETDNDFRKKFSFLS